MVREADKAKAAVEAVVVGARVAAKAVAEAGARAAVEAAEAADSAVAEVWAAARVCPEAAWAEEEDVNSERITYADIPSQKRKDF